jgi:hypothetical protein
MARIGPAALAAIRPARQGRVHAFSVVALEVLLVTRSPATSAFSSTADLPRRNGYVSLVPITAVPPSDCGGAVELRGSVMMDSVETPGYEEFCSKGALHCSPRNNSSKLRTTGIVACLYNIQDCLLRVNRTKAADDSEFQGSVLPIRTPYLNRRELRRPRVCSCRPCYGRDKRPHRQDASRSLLNNLKWRGRSRL